MEGQLAFIGLQDFCKSEVERYRVKQAFGEKLYWKLRYGGTWV